MPKAETVIRGDQKPPFGRTVAGRTLCSRQCGQKVANVARRWPKIILEWEDTVRRNAQRPVKPTKAVGRRHAKS